MNTDLDNEILAESMTNNLIRESGGVAADIGQYAPMILPLIQKIYPDSLVSQIASVQPSHSPVAKIAALYTMYSGQDVNITLDNAWIVTVPVGIGSQLNIGDVCTNATSQFTVAYMETTEKFESTYAQAGPFTPGAELTRGFPDTYTQMLVVLDSGTISTGDTFTLNGTDTVLLYVSSNRNVIKRVFKDYSVVLEDNSNLRQVNFETKTSTLTMSTRKVLSKFSPEQLQDWQALYKAKGNELAAKFIADEIRQEIDREVVTYMKSIATPMMIDVDVTQSVSKTGGDLGGMTYDIYFAIFKAIEEIVRATKRNRTMFILADSTTCAFMSLNALQSNADPKISNPYCMGNIGPYPLYCDPFSTENYVMVGYKFNSDSKDDAGLIFSPYTSTVMEVPDPNNFATNFLTINRYGFTRHPQDTGKDTGDSDFFRYFSVNYFDAFSPVANLSNQIQAYY